LGRDGGPEKEKKQIAPTNCDSGANPVEKRKVSREFVPGKTALREQRGDGLKKGG